MNDYYPTEEELRAFRNLEKLSYLDNPKCLFNQQQPTRELIRLHAYDGQGYPAWIGRLVALASECWEKDHNFNKREDGFEEKDFYRSRD